jgi:hypothetical protein
MRVTEYEKLLAKIVPLDLATLARLAADLSQLVKQRQVEKSKERRPIMELAAMAGESLRGLEPNSYWVDRENDLAASRTSWAELENEFDLEHRL